MLQQLPWILASLSLALLLGAGLLALRSGAGRRQPLPTQWTLTARPVFGSDERRAYRQLREALPHHVVLSKLPLVRFCQPLDPSQVRYWYELLGAINVSFAICSPSGRVLVAVDLETERIGSRRSQQIKQSVLAACKVRYLCCTADRLPSLPELQQLVPPLGPAGRGLQAAPAVSMARNQLASTLASKRRERSPQWADSSFAQDSFFGGDSRQDGGSVSSYGSLTGGMTVRELQVRSDETGGIVIESPPPALRH